MYQPKRLKVTRKAKKRYLSACLAAVMLLSLLQPLTVLAAEPTYTIKSGETPFTGAQTISPTTPLELVFSTSTSPVTVTLPAGLTRTDTTAAITAEDSTSTDVSVTSAPLSGQELTITLTTDGAAYTTPYTITVPVELDYDALATRNGTITVGGTTLTVESAMPGEDDGFQLIPSLHKYNSSGGMGDALGGDDTDSIENLDEGVICYFKFHIEDTSKYHLSDCGFKPGVRYPLGNLGDKLSVDLLGTSGLEVDISGFGKLHITHAKDVYVIFSDVECLDVEVGFGCHVAAKAEDKDHPGTFIIELPGSKKVTFPVESEKAKGPKLEKAVGTPDDAGVTTWTITYTPAEPTYEGDQPTQLVDTLPDGLAYVPDSFSVTAKDGTPIATGSMSFNEEQNTLTWTIPTLTPKKPADPITLTYQTKFTNEAVASRLWQGGDKTFENTVQGENAGGPIDKLTASATLDAGEWAAAHQPLNKTVKKVADEARTVEWTVTVYPMGFGYETLTLIDTLGPALSLDTTTLTVKAGNGTAETLTTDKYEYDTTTRKLTLPIYKEVDGTGTLQFDPADKYVITYQTTIAEGWYTHALNTDTANNSARLEWSFPAGEGPGFTPTPKVVKPTDNNSGVTQAMLEKTATGYNHKTRMLTWQVTINPNQVNMTSATFKDELNVTKSGSVEITSDGTPGKPRSELVYDDTGDDSLEKVIQDALPSGASISNFEYTKETFTSTDDAKTGFSFKINNLGENSLTFTYQSKVADEDAWFWAANNGATPFYNKADLDSIVIGTAATTIDVAPVYAVQSPSNTVLTKKPTAYDPTTHTMTWTLKVNEKGIELKNVSVTDTLPAHMTYVADTGKVTVGSDEKTPTHAAPEGERETLTWTLGDLTASVEITYQTKIDFGSFGATERLADLTFTNSATIKAANDITSPVTSTAAITNNVLTKKAGALDGNKATFKIEVNPLGVPIIPAGSSYLTLVDTPSVGLIPDIDSLKVYKATATASSSSPFGVSLSTTGATPLTQKTDFDPAHPSLSSTEYGVKFNPNDNSFEVTLPGNGPYILTYDAYLMQANADLTNDVMLKGSVAEETSAPTQRGSARYAAFGSARSFKMPASFYGIKLLKVSETGTALKGAEFALYTSQAAGETPIATVVSDEDGVCAFSFSSSLIPTGTTHVYIKETNAPDGYQLKTDWIKIEVSTLSTWATSHPGEIYEYPGTVVNQPVSTTPPSGGVPDPTPPPSGPSGPVVPALPALPALPVRLVPPAHPAPPAHLALPALPALPAPPVPPERLTHRRTRRSLWTPPLP